MTLPRFLLIGALVALPVLVVAADEPQGQTISLKPATVSMSVPAGEVTLQTLYFSNHTGATKTFKVQRADYDFTSKDDRGIQFLDAGATRDSLHNMLDVTPVTFELKDGETQELLVRLRPSTTTASGQYKGALFIGEQASSSDDASIQVVGRVGSIIGLTVTDGNPLTGAALDPASTKPSAMMIAFLSIVILAFFGAGISAARVKIQNDNKFY